MLITFSGLDGAGKSSLIRELRTNLEEQCLRVTVLTMYDHIGLYAAGRFMRDWLGRLASGITRRGSSVYGNGHSPSRGWLGAGMLRLLRASSVKRCIYLVDLVILLFCRLYVEVIRGRVLVIDRYFYDSLADVAGEQPSLYTRLFLRLVPVPDLPILVDATPEQAWRRKGEYSVEYLTRRRGIYQEIFAWVPRSIVIVNQDWEKAVTVLANSLRRIGAQ